MKAYLDAISEIKIGYQSREGIRSNNNGSHRLIQARDFNKQHRLQWQSLICFMPSENSNKYELRQSDVLFLAKGQDFFSFLIDQNVSNTLAANTFYIVRVKSEHVLPDYLAWWLNQAPAQEYLLLNRSGSSLPFVPVSVLSKLEIPIPDIEIQKKIGKLEKLRKKEEDLLREYMNKKSALIEAVCLKAISETGE